jgi:hypothetical protein
MNPTILAMLNSASTVQGAYTILASLGIYGDDAATYVAASSVGNGSAAASGGASASLSPATPSTPVAQNLMAGVQTGTGLVNTAGTLSNIGSKGATATSAAVKAAQGAAGSAESTLASAQSNLAIDQNSLAIAESNPAYSADVPFIQNMVASDQAAIVPLQGSASAANLQLDAATKIAASTSSQPSGMFGNIKGEIKSLFNNPIVAGVTATVAAGLGAYGVFSLAQGLGQHPTAMGAIGTIMSGFSAFEGLTSAAFQGILQAISTSFLSQIPLLGSLLHFLPFLSNPIVAVVLLAGLFVWGLLKGLLKGTKVDGSGTPTSSAINSMLAKIPAWYQTIPSTAVVMMSAGLTIGGMSYNLSPGSLYQSFTVPTVQLSQGLQASTGQTMDASTLGSHIFMQQGAGPNGSDEVTLVNNNGANSSTIQFFVNKQGYVVGSDPSTYPPIFQPTGVDSTGVATGYKTNYGALDAILQVPACAAIANDPSLSVQTREAALESCLVSSKALSFVPTGS